MQNCHCIGFPGLILKTNCFTYSPPQHIKKRKNIYNFIILKPRKKENKIKTTPLKKKTESTLHIIVWIMLHEPLDWPQGKPHAHIWEWEFFNSFETHSSHVRERSSPWSSVRVEWLNSYCLHAMLVLLELGWGFKTHIMSSFSFTLHIKGTMFDRDSHAFTA